MLEIGDLFAGNLDWRVGVEGDWYSERGSCGFGRDASEFTFDTRLGTGPRHVPPHRMQLDSGTWALAAV